MKKILIITPKFPYPVFGACEQDRAAGIELFIKNGWEVRVITKIYDESYQSPVAKQARLLGIKIIALPYNHLGKNKKISWRRLLPCYWDGAAYEYSDPTIKTVLRAELNDFKPDLVWFDYTYLWPLYGLVKKQKIPIITRSINFEPTHFLDEDGRNWWNYIKALPKLFSEYLVVKNSKIIFAITPKEADIYKKMGHKNVFILPLRGLPNCLKFTANIIEKEKLNVFFVGSTYNVSHNRAALEFLLKKIAPLAEEKFPNKFIFHIFGKKMPNNFLQLIDNNKIIYHQYFESAKYEELLAQMDIAIVPSLYGAGMQQKIFEPLARGFPLITSARGLARYDFIDQMHLLLADSAVEYVEALGKLQDFILRQRLSLAAKIQSEKLFSIFKLNKIIFDNI